MKIKSLTTSIILLIFAQFQSFAQIIPAYVPQNGLVGWWPFNGNANDESGNVNNGTVNGATLTNDRFNINNSAYTFNGNGNFIEILNSNVLNPTEITISAWYNVSQNYVFGNLTILSKQNHINSTSYSYGLGIDSLTQKKSIAYSTIGCSNQTGFGGDGFKVVSTTEINTWYLISTTINNNGLSKIYINGIEIGSYQGLPFSPCNNSLSDLRIGHWWNGDNQWFNGKIDDIGIWNRALNQQEITSLYTGCNLNASISPSSLTGQIQQNVLFNGSANSGSFVWQTNPNDIGWTNVPTNSTYSGQGSSTLGINNLQLSNHNQPFRLIATNGECIDTSDVTFIQILDTCVSNITTYDTILVAVEDTLNINATISSVTPSQTNTFKVYPNPASTQLTIDNGNLSLLNGYTITIQNSLGQEVFNQPITQQVFIIDLNTWTGSGIYHLIILDNLGNVIENKKIVLQ